MSLINDALKKARNQSAASPHQASSHLTATDPTQSPYRGRGESPSFLSWFLVTAVITVLAVTCAILAMVLFYQSTDNDTAAKQASIEAPATPPAQSLLPAASLLPEAESFTRPAEPDPKSAASASAPAEADAEPAAPLTEAKPESPQPFRAPSAADRIETMDDASTPSQAVVHWLAESTVTGVRLANEQSRVMLNGRSYRLGETVHFELGIVVRAIQENRVLFEDARGVRYVKHF
jgi:hypothetical protein